MKIITVFVVLILTAAPSFAFDVYYVNGDSPNTPGLGSQTDPFRAIKSAMDIATENSTIIIAPGTYTGSQNRDIDTAGINVTIRSENPNDQAIVAETIIDCGGGENDFHRAFVIQTGETNVIIEGLTVTNGNAPPLLERANSYTKMGGAIGVAKQSTVTIRKCRFISNYASYGGAIGCSSSTVIISDCEIIQNETQLEGNGGGIYATGCNLHIADCRINGNYSFWEGGAIAASYSEVTIENTDIQNNTADIDGGGINFRMNTIATVSNCLITNNTVIKDGNGGGINCTSTRPMQITNCSIINNFAEYGGGIAMIGSDALITNSLIRENTASNGPQIALRTGNPQSSLSITFSNIQHGSEKIYVDSNILNYNSTNIDIDPAFASFDPNSDPATWDFHLKSTSGRYENGTWVNDVESSPCLDAGDPATAWTKEPWPNGKRINMGAYANTDQASKTGNIADLNIDGKVDGFDLAYIINSWLDDPVEYEDLSLDGKVNLQDLSIMSMNWL